MEWRVRIRGSRLRCRVNRTVAGLVSLWANSGACEHLPSAAGEVAVPKSGTGIDSSCVAPPDGAQNFSPSSGQWEEPRKLPAASIFIPVAVVVLFLALLFIFTKAAAKKNGPAPVRGRSVSVPQSAREMI